MLREKAHQRLLSTSWACKKQTTTISYKKQTTVATCQN